MMSFYEEFGVRNDASVEDIRQAYKTLARVLHPDSQTDEKLRAAAACQMKRLHEVLDVLLDPGKRRAYDESLAAHWGPPAQTTVPPPDRFDLRQSVLRHWSWILMGCMIFGSGFWYVTARVPTAVTESASNTNPYVAPPDRTAPVLRPGDPVAGRAARVPAGEPRASSAPLVALPEETASSPELPRLAAVPAPPPRTIPGPVRAAVDSANAPERREPEYAPSVPSAGRSSFAGDWFYVPAIEKPDPHLYPPVDIDFQLTEKNGVLGGHYRGRYKVPDAAVPQDVLFEVQGKSPAGSSAVLSWTSSDGAAGEVDLVLRQPNLMKVTWWTTKAGRRPALSSGAATLFRQLDSAR